MFIALASPVPGARRRIRRSSAHRRLKKGYIGHPCSFCLQEGPRAGDTDWRGHAEGCHILLLQQAVKGGCVDGLSVAYITSSFTFWCSYGKIPPRASVDQHERVSPRPVSVDRQAHVIPARQRSWRWRALVSKQSQEGAAMTSLMIQRVYDSAVQQDMEKVGARTVSITQGLPGHHLGAQPRGRATSP